MKKGFTLIELLAVIVILAVIAIIAVPTLVNVISKTRINALKDSAYGIIEAGRIYSAQNELEQDTLFRITNNVITSEQTNKALKYKGNIKNGIVVVTTTSNVAVCIDDGTNYAVKLLNETEVSTGIGTCESYESENGQFTVNSPIAELRKEYERRLASQKEYYEGRIDNLEDEIANGGAIYLGEYSDNTSIDVSNLGATSADQFIAVASGIGTQVKNWQHGSVQNGWENGWTTYANPTLSLNYSTLTVNVGVLSIEMTGSAGSSGGARWRLPTKVYYVGNVKTQD